MMTTRIPLTALAAAGLLVAVGCSTKPEPPALPLLGVTAAIGIDNLCAEGTSPEIRLVAAPATATRYRVRMVNIDVLFGPTWEEDLPGASGVIAAGVAQSYIPPCPAPQTVYEYRLAVTALDPAGKELASGLTYVTVRSPAELAERRTRPPGAVEQPSRPNVFGDPYGLQRALSTK